MSHRRRSGSSRYHRQQVRRAQNTSAASSVADLGPVAVAGQVVGEPLEELARRRQPGGAVRVRARPHDVEDDAGQGGGGVAPQRVLADAHLTPDGLGQRVEVPVERPCREPGRLRAGAVRGRAGPVAPVLRLRHEREAGGQVDLEGVRRGRRGDVREPAARQPQTHTGPEHPQRRTLEERRRRHPPVAGEPAGAVRSEQVCQHAARLEERCGRDPAAAPGAGGDLVRAQRAAPGGRRPRPPGAPDRPTAGSPPSCRSHPRQPNGPPAASQHASSTEPILPERCDASAIARSPLCYGARRSHGKPVGVRRGPRHCDQGATLQEATGRTGRRPAGKAQRSVDLGARRPAATDLREMGTPT